MPFSIQLHTNITDNHLYFLQPRSETIIEIDLNNKEIEEGITPEIQIKPGIYLAKSIVSVKKNGKAVTSILNSTENIFRINQIKLNLEPIKETYHFNGKMIQTNKYNRMKPLRKHLRIDHSNQEEKSLLEICENFNDLFYLPNDDLTTTDTLQHEIVIENI